MGATAFALLGDASDKTFQKWNEDEKPFTVAEKAVIKDRANRYQSIDEFAAALIYE